MPQSERLLLRSTPTEDTGPETGLTLGRALAMDCRRVVVARDLMRSSSMMKEALVAGLLSAGVDVIDIGVASGPVAALAASQGDCAVLVTEYRGYGMVSGYLLINPDGSLFRMDQIRHLRRVFVDPPAPARSGSLGHVTRYDGATADYNRLLANGSADGAQCAVALDCGCGPAAMSAPQALNAMGATVICVNAQVDIDFVSDGMDGMGLDTSAIEGVSESAPGTIGIALNKIGTMMAVLDEKGQEVTPEQALALIVMHLRPESVAVPIDTSSLVSDALAGRLDGSEDRDAELIMTERSAGAVSAAVAAGADLGFYEGGIMFGGGSVMPDAIKAAAVITEIAGRDSISRTVGSFPDYRRDSATVECACPPDAFVRAIVEELEGADGTVTAIGEAWRVDMEGGWFMVSLRRGDDPEVRIDAESKDRAYLIGLMELAGDLVADCMRGQ